jgi:dihydroorotase
MFDPLWLRGGYLIDPIQGHDAPGDVLIVDGIVHASGDPALVAQAARALADAGRSLHIRDLPASSIVAPGFIDLHTHLREPGFELRETVRSGARAAARGGYTTICCMPNTSPALDDRGAVAWLRELAEGADARVLPIAAITKGQEGTTLTEMAELAEAGAIAFSDDGKPVRSAQIMRRALAYSSDLDRPIINHCEDPDLVAGSVMHEGAVAARLGLRGWPSAGETIMLQRDIELARLTGGRYHAAHLSTAASADLIRQAKDLDPAPRITAEVTPHHLLLTHAWVAGEREGLLATADRGPRYDTHAKVNPPLRTLDDADGLVRALQEGVIDVVATDHAPHSEVEKVCTFDEAAFGISGLETALGVLMALVHAGRLTLSRLIGAMANDPASIFNLSERIGRPIGTLASGAAGDVAIFDPNETWQVDPAAFASRGRNTPLAGIELRGRVRLTVLGGRIVYDASLTPQPPLYAGA